MSDLISRDFSGKALREYAEQKHAVGQTELANGILKAVNFLQKEENVPTVYDVKKVCEQLGEKSFDVEIEDDHIIPESNVKEYFNVSVIGIETAIEIVRNGGKE